MTFIKNLYFHIPFCARICHYCDFAKTALFSQQQIDEYISALLVHFTFFQEKIALKPCESIFFGGGTPSLLTNSYAPLLEQLKPFILSSTEITLEANPIDITLDNLKIWRELGFNRLSIGLQTFSESGLKFLTRDHTSDQAKTALTLAKKFFSNVSVDLIYGWKNQTLENWQNDLDLLADFELQHVSCYHLMYEPKTPLGRAYLRQKVTRDVEALEHASENFYTSACNALKNQGFEHYEVSNWAKENAQSKHNKNYWKNNYFLGLGTGAHGFIPGFNPTQDSAGIRYFYNAQFRPFLKGQPETVLIWEKDRSRDDFILEACANGMRSAMGIDFSSIENKFSVKFIPNPLITEGLARGLLQVHGNTLTLSETEWFRENAWALEVSESC